VKINGATALITGANGGLGQFLTAQLIRRGANRVYAAARRRDSSLDALVATDMERIVPMVLDITDDGQARAAAQAAADVDLLVNNAGVMSFGTPSQTELAAVDRDMQVNFVGTLRVTKAFIPVLEANHGTLVNILSALALAPITGMSPYSASKAAGRSMTQVLRADLASRGITVVGVYPGAMDTPMMAGVDSPKADPSDVAMSVIDAIEAGVEDITPDRFSTDAYALWLKDPKALERQFAAF
jgi:NAD(P)-dependent dehydrogenase (short-subunit alcohol dehydrogenase family)